MAAGGFLQSTKGGFVSTGGGGGGSALSLAEEGSELTAGTLSINVVGAALTATESGDAVTITQGTWGTSSVIGPATMTLGSDADGDTYYRTSNVLTRLGKGAAAEVLTMNAGATAPEWAAAGGGGQTLGSVALADGANISTNAALGNIFTCTLAGNRTLDNPTNITAGETYHFQITQDGTGSRTLAYGSYFKWAGGAAPVLTTTGAKIDFIVVTAVSTTLLYGSIEYDFA
jgi:hypothetical protein